MRGVRQRGLLVHGYSQAPDSVTCGRKWMSVCSLMHVRGTDVQSCTCISVRRVHEGGDWLTVYRSTLPPSTTLASLAAVCQRGPVHRCMVARQLGPCWANQGRMQQFSPWHIKGSECVLLQFNWFCFSVTGLKSRQTWGPWVNVSDA